jgi:drug/metabolite transporter (DMT)-like permease
VPDPLPPRIFHPTWAKCRQVYGPRSFLGPLHSEYSHQQCLPVSLVYLLAVYCTRRLITESNLVTVPFHQVVRALTPIFTIAINAVFFQQNYGKMTYLSLIPVISGVGLATFGDYYYTEAGLLLTLLGTFFAALKTVATNRIQTGFSMHLNAFEILYHMSPLAFFQSLIYSYLSGELYRFEMTDSAHYTFSAIISTILILGINGFLAFILNYVSFTANKKTGALTMTVAANIKQILTILTSVIFFELQMGWLNMVGIFLTLLGGAWYAKVELEAKALRA